MNTATKNLVLPKELEKRFVTLDRKIGSYIAPGTKEAEELKDLMCDLKKAGLFLHKFEVSHKGSDHKDYFTPDYHSVYFDFFRSSAHGVQYLRVIYTKYEVLEGALHSGEEHISTSLLAGDDEYRLWID